MGIKSFKEWTILIYANGNNELEPEIWKSKLDAEKIGSDENINIIMQIGRLPRKLIKILRTKKTIVYEGDEWTGTRRYYIENPNSPLISDLGNINMTDPHVLYNFIKWGFTNYPSRHRMLVIGGHGFSYVAVMTDFSQDVPYMMGVPQMCKAISLAMEDVGGELDILSLDACYMNTIEIVYELGRKNKNPIKYLLTYIEDGPLIGLPCDELILSLKRNLRINNTETILKNIVNSLNRNLAVIKINHKKLKNIKDIVNRLAYTYLSCGEYNNISPKEVIYTQNINHPWYKHSIKYKKSIQKIILYYRNKSSKNSHIIDIAHQNFRISENKMDYITLIYLNLSFCRNNYWTSLLTRRALDKPMDNSFTSLNLPLEPTVMHPKTIGKIINYMNAPLTVDEINETMKKLYLCKHWTNNTILNRLYTQLKSILPKTPDNTNGYP